MRYLRRRFTYWYIKRGYIFGYDDHMNTIWKCPWWVKPLLIFFSPSVYFRRKYGELFCESFEKGLSDVRNFV